MTVIGAGTHKQSHTCAAARAGTGELLGELTAAARKPGFSELLDWGCSLDGQRIRALEDCRHVSGSFERFLIAHGERVVRVPPKLMGVSRKGERAAGKSDAIDALAVARAALHERPRRSQRRIWMSARWRSSCCSTTARISSAHALRTSSGCAHGSSAGAEAPPRARSLAGSSGAGGHIHERRGQD